RRPLLRCAPAATPTGSGGHAARGGMTGFGLHSGGRLTVFAAAVVASAATLAGGAQTAGAKTHGPSGGTPAALLDEARAHPKATFRVIARGRPGDSSAAVAAEFARDGEHGLVTHRFSSIDGVAGTLTGAGLVRLA